MTRRDGSPARRRPVLALVAVTLVAAAVMPRADAHRGASQWSLRVVMSKIDGAKVIVGRWSGRVDAESTLCSGEGLGRKWSGVRHWRHFTCTWTVFAGGRIAHDVTFRVHVVAKKRFAITRARFGTA